MDTEVSTEPDGQAIVVVGTTELGGVVTGTVVTGGVVTCGFVAGGVVTAGAVTTGVVVIGAVEVVLCDADVALEPATAGNGFERLAPPPVRPATRPETSPARSTTHTANTAFPRGVDRGRREDLGGAIEFDRGLLEGWGAFGSGPGPSSGGYHLKSDASHQPGSGGELSRCCSGGYHFRSDACHQPGPCETSLIQPPGPID